MSFFPKYCGNSIGLIKKHSQKNRGMYYILLFLSYINGTCSAPTPIYGVFIPLGHISLNTSCSHVTIYSWHLMAPIQQLVTPIHITLGNTLWAPICVHFPNISHLPFDLGPLYTLQNFFTFYTTTMTSQQKLSAISIPPGPKPASSPEGSRQLDDTSSPPGPSIPTQAVSTPPTAPSRPLPAKGNLSCTTACIICIPQGASFTPLPLARDSN